MDNNEKPTEGTSETGEELSFGAWLREQREKKKISLEEIAAVTKVHISQLQNIESGKNTDLPASAFVRGFLINYARHVGIEETEVLRRYRKSLAPDIQKELGVARNTKAAQAPTNPKVKVVHTPSFQNAPGAKGVDEEPSKWTQPKTIMIVAGLVLVLAALAFLVALGKKTREKGESPAESAEVAESSPANATPAAPPTSTAAGTTPVTAPQAPATAPATGAATATTPTTAGAPVEVAAPKNQLELRAMEPTWLSVRVDEASLQSMTLRPGTPFTTGLQRRAQIYLSNAGVVELRWNGTWYESPGFRGDVKSLVLPDQLSELKARSAPAVVRPRPKPSAPPAEAPPSE